ncbi:MAG: methyltransferase domain-containing protein [Nitrospira sp. BO4]|jgi:SAM-dependent methyltransferase|nr:methyltransferase domain-containing protein [Nitrospira sp. BO4]
MVSDSLQRSLREHLAWWGLRRFTSDREYFAWQRRQLSSEDLKLLALRVERKRNGDRDTEIAFYDLTAHPTIFPVLYSQRYEYYEAIGRRTIASLSQAKNILDFGCGLGILTTFYARHFRDRTFVGVDRSAASLAVARKKAHELGLDNLRFECVDAEAEPLPGVYDLILTAHALLQAEHDPGLPSQSWRTFERARNVLQQASFERRTGLGARLDRLCEVLHPNGRMIASEKTRQLARRVPFQRALAHRGLQPVETPAPIQYRSIEEAVEDGPFYLMQKGGQTVAAWDERPEQDSGQVFAQNAVPVATDPRAPLYENHWPSAQAAWEQLENREVAREMTHEGPEGRQLHVERGASRGLQYLYCANTFDQRQLVIVEEAYSAMVDSYYQEIVDGVSKEGGSK